MLKYIFLIILLLVALLLLVFIFACLKMTKEYSEEEMRDFYINDRNNSKRS